MLLEIFSVSPRSLERGDTRKISNKIEPIRGNLSEHIYMLLEIFPVSPRGFESFTRRFKRGGGWSTWS